MSNEQPACSPDIDDMAASDRLARWQAARRRVEQVDSPAARMDERAARADMEAHGEAVPNEG